MNSRGLLRSEVGDLLSEIDAPSSVDIDDVHPRNLVQVASYNWIEDRVPTIMVPGAPAKWTPKTCPIRIQQDHGLMHIDQNAYRHPECPLEPLFRSVYELNPQFNPKPIGLVTDRNNLRKIVWSILGEDTGDFRVDIALAGDTLLFTRWEKNVSENFTEFCGFGHSSEMMRSTGHHRIIQYTVYTLAILARFEVDGFLSDIAEGPRIDTGVGGF